MILPTRKYRKNVTLENYRDNRLLSEKIIKTETTNNINNNIQFTYRKEITIVKKPLL